MLFLVALQYILHPAFLISLFGYFYFYFFYKWLFFTNFNPPGKLCDCLLTTLAVCFETDKQVMATFSCIMHFPHLVKLYRILAFVTFLFYQE